SNFAAPTAEQAAARSIRIVLTHDNRYAIASAFPSKAETEKAKKERKRPDEMPRNSMIIVDLTNLSASRVADVASFQIPELGESFVAYLRGAKAGAAAGTTENGQDSDQRRGGAPAQGGSVGRGARKQFGSDLMLRDLRTSKERAIAEVLEYSMAKDGKTL